MKEALRLMGLFKPAWPWVLLGIFLALITILANVSLMALSGWFIAAMAIAGAAGASMNYFTPAGAIRGLSIARTAGRYFERLVTHAATFRMLARLRHWFYLKLEPLAPAGLQGYHSGDLLNRISSDIDKLENLYLRILTPFTVAFLSSAVFAAFLAWLNPLYAIIVVTLLAIAGIAIPLLAERLGRQPGEEIAQLTRSLRTVVVDGVQGMAELEVYGQTEQQKHKIEQLSLRLLACQRKLANYAGLVQAATGLCANLTMWLLLLAAIPEVNRGELPPAQLSMLALFALAAFESILPLPLAMQTWGETKTAAQRLFAIADTPPPIAEPEAPKAIPTTLDIHFDEVWLTYPGAQNPALKGVTLDIPQGSSLGIVGATGSGKSSLTNLLLRFYEPDRGQVMLGGIALPALHTEALRAQLAVVPQRAHLFNTSIEQNLLLANPEASQAQIEQACRLACIHDFIIAQPEGYLTEVGETGVKVSGGQARRIAIARALLKNAPILILDEPAEGLDAATEQAVIDNLLQAAKDKTVVLITHRPAGLEQLDQIVVMHQGKITERGTHTQLLATAPIYQALFNRFSEIPSTLPS